MSFAFNFSGEDVDDSNNVAIAPPPPSQVATRGEEKPVGVPVQEHSLKEWLHLLPSQLSWTKSPIISPTGKTLPIPRRALFDIRTQLMAEDASTTLGYLETSDLRSHIYEGGFKTWECSIDLASLLLDRGPRKDIDELVRVAHVVELGAGTALPSLVLFERALRMAYPVSFTLADFNADVLRLVTVPNLLLGWALVRDRGGLGDAESGEFEITEEVLEAFTNDLDAARITIRLLSGPWGADLLDLMPVTIPDMTTLILAAETIYSPDTLADFVELLAHILKGGPMNKAMVAAKKFYFGVGGSVDSLKVSCQELGLIAAEVENSGLPGMEVGVGRAVIEVQTT